ncbi:MAG: DMT family transporter, partial [Anaerolineae bacterium]|nr:DMT family transporter [Anaerolineae bacterium]
MPFIGELAALFTSFCWSLSAIGFTFGGRLVGSQVVNRVRVALAFLALLVINWALYGKPIPFDAGSERWFWLTLSGIVGLAFGDAFLFQSYQLVGPRIGLLMMSLAPIFGTIIAWLFLGETLTTLQFAGMVIAMLGIAWVVLARNSGGVVD